MAQLTTRQCYANIPLTFTTLAGDPATVDGAPVWVSSNPAVVDVVVSSDGMTGTINSVAVGVGAVVAVTADADLGEGVVPLHFIFEPIDVVLDPRDVPMAAVISATLPAPTDKA